MTAQSRLELDTVWENIKATESNLKNFASKNSVATLETAMREDIARKISQISSALQAQTPKGDSTADFEKQLQVINARIDENIQRIEQVITQV